MEKKSVICLVREKEIIKFEIKKETKTTEPALCAACPYRELFGCTGSAN